MSLDGARSRAHDELAGAGGSRAAPVGLAIAGGDREGAQEHLTTALAMYRDVASWLRRTR